jgi:DNA-binding MarR family transcriptional regulator
VLEDLVLAGTGVTGNDYVTLLVIARRGPFAPAAALHEFLAGQRQLGLTPDTAADLLDRLERRGLISDSSRDSAGPVTLTAEGSAQLARLSASVAPVTQQLYGGIHPDDLATAHRVLREVVGRAEHLLAVAALR